MAFNVCNPVSCFNKPISSIIPSTDNSVYSTDIGRFIWKSSFSGMLAKGGSSFSTSLLLGYIVSVPEDSTAGSTIPFYYRKFDPSVELEITYTTAGGGGHPQTTDLGKYIGFSSLATVAGCVMDMQWIGNDPGTSDGRWLQISGFSTSRRKVRGYPAVNSSMISW
jgi:hypothetical protein